MNNVHPKKILVVGPAWVGDMMMAQVLFKLLRQQYPDAAIHVLAPAWSEALTARMPEVTKTLVLPFSHGQFELFKRYQFGRVLRAEHYDHAFVLPNSWKSAIIPFAARISKRTGWVGEFRYGLLNDYRRLNKKKFPKMIERFAALTFPEGAVLPEILPLPELISWREDAEAALKKYALSTDQPILALCPGAEFGPSKCWLPSYYAQVANQKLQEGWQVWLLGSNKDKSITDQINHETQESCANLAGKTSLSEAVDLLSRVTSVVTNDSGLMHIACALGKPVIAVYGSTSPEFTPPLSPHAHILKTALDCQPCFQRTCPLKHHHCMKKITPEQVLGLLTSSPS